MIVRLYVTIRLVTVRLCAAAGQLSRLVRRKVAMLCTFTVGSLESFKSCLLFLVALLGLIDSLAQLLAWRSLLWLSMTWRRRYLTQSNFLSTTSLAWSLALHLLFCFSQKPLRWGSDIFFFYLVVLISFLNYSKTVWRYWWMTRLKRMTERVRFVIFASMFHYSLIHSSGCFIYMFQNMYSQDIWQSM